MTLLKSGQLVLVASIFASLLIGSLAGADIVAGVPIPNSSTDVTVTRLTLEKPVGTIAGTLLLASIAVNGGTSAVITPPVNWQEVNRMDNDVNVALITYKKIAGAIEPVDYRWEVANQATMQGGITPYNGIDPNNPIATSTGKIGNGTTATTGNLPVPNASSTIVTVFAVPAGKIGTVGNYFSIPIGEAEKMDSSNTPFGPSIASFDSIQATAGTTGVSSSTITTSKNLNWASQIIVLNMKPEGPADNFESSAIGALNGQDGGTGWTSSWSGPTVFQIQNSVVFEGTHSVRLTNPNHQEPFIQRSFAPRTSGTLHWAQRKDQGSHGASIGLFSGSQYVGGVGIGSDTQPGRQWVMRAGFADIGIETYELGTFGTVDLEFDTNTDMYRASINGGPYTDWVYFSQQVNVDSVDNIRIVAGSSGSETTDMYWDDIRFTK